MARFTDFSGANAPEGFTDFYGLEADLVSNEGTLFTENTPLIDGGTVNITGTQTNDFMQGGAEANKFVGLNGHDYLFGGAGNDTLLGGWGSDRLVGENGNDRLYGGPNSDKLWGGGGHDILVGGWGDDYLSGGTGADILTGGVGQDSFLINGNDWGRDTITDLDLNAGEKIQVLNWNPDHLDSNCDGSLGVADSAVSRTKDGSMLIHIDSDTTLTLSGFSSVDIDSVFF